MTRVFRRHISQSRFPGGGGGPSSQGDRRRKKRRRVMKNSKVSCRCLFACCFYWMKQGCRAAKIKEEHDPRRRCLGRAVLRHCWNHINWGRNLHYSQGPVHELCNVMGQSQHFRRRSSNRKQMIKKIKSHPPWRKYGVSCNSIFISFVGNRFFCHRLPF